MKQVSYHETETLYAAGRSLEEARKRLENHAADNSLDAWEDLGYWERQDTPEEFEVFEFVTTTEITKVDPPYSR